MTKDDLKLPKMDKEETLQTKLEELKRLNRNRFDFVLARSRLSSNDAALNEISLTKGWYYKFSEEERRYLEELANELHYEQAIQAVLILTSKVNDAAQIKVEGLKSTDKRIQQDVASEILDRVIGRPMQRNEITGKDDAPLKIVVTLRGQDD